MAPEQGFERKRLPADKRIRSILEAAAEVFAEKGYRQSSVSDMVQRAGIARGTFYLYFDSKREVFLKLIQSYFEDIAALLWKNRLVLEDVLRSSGDPLIA